MPNLYATPSDVRYSASYEIKSSMDETLIRFLESASRAIDQHTRRHFYPSHDSRYFDGPNGGDLLIPDVLSLSSFAADSENDGTWDGETWTEGTDFYLESLRDVSAYPKTCIRTTGRGSYSFSRGHRRYKATGLWGYGNGESATPWSGLGVTATVADSTSTAVMISAPDVVAAGMLIRCGTEFMEVMSESGATVTVTRGVNGSTAAAHSSADVYQVEYPRMITQCAVDMCVESFFNRFDITTQVGTVAMEGFNFSRNEEIFWRHLRMISEYRSWDLS